MQNDALGVELVDESAGDRRWSAKRDPAPRDKGPRKKGEIITVSRTRSLNRKTQPLRSALHLAKGIGPGVWEGPTLRTAVGILAEEKGPGGGPGLSAKSRGPGIWGNGEDPVPEETIRAKSATVAVSAIGIGKGPGNESVRDNNDERQPGPYSTMAPYAYPRPQWS